MSAQLVQIQLDQEEACVSEYADAHKISSSWIFHIRPELKELSIKQVRDIQAELRFAGSAPRLFVLHEFDTASAEVQNALLKSLEEHEETIHFLLLVRNQYSALPTIISRCEVVVRFEQEDKIKPATSISEQEPENNKLVGVKTSIEAQELMDALIARERKSLRESGDSKRIRTLLRLRNSLLHNQITPQSIADMAILA